MTAITNELARYATEVKFERLPEEVLEKAKQLILDLLGIALRASVDEESSSTVFAATNSIAAPGEASVIGYNVTMSPAHAALINGTLAHSLDFDDTHREGSVHPGASVIPTVLALAEQEALDGKRMLAAIVAGYEVLCKLAMALRPKSHYDRGFHPTATAGVFGATAAGANLLGFTADELNNAFGINGSQAAGSMQFLENGSWNKRLHPGLAAHNAIFALQLARHGFTGSAAAIEGTYGFLRSYSDDAQPELSIAGLGVRYEILQTAVKPYPACRYAHAPLDSIIDLANAHDLRPDEIESVTIGLSDAGLAIIGTPLEKKRRPENIVDGQFSMPFLAAVALTRRRMAWGDYELLGDPGINSLMQRIDVVSDPEANRVHPEKWLSTVVIRARGQQWEDQRWQTRGEPELPLTWAEIKDKFEDLAGPVLPAERRRQLIDLVLNLEQVPNARQLGELLRVN